MLIPETEVIFSLEGQELLRRVVRPGEYFIGRTPACELCVDSTTVSRKHAKLTVNYSNLFLEDLDSFNGTTVNSGLIKGKTQIWHGQRIQLGHVSLKLRKIVADTEHGASLAPAQSVVMEALPEDVRFHHSGYEIGQLIGRGGMGAVLEAEDASLQRKVAMKVLPQGDSSGDVLRFINEARITGRLEHPHIVPVHTLGADEHGLPFYTMKLVRGSTLKEVLTALAHGEEDAIRSHPLSNLLTIFQKVCDGIRFAHSQKIIHRDLKPDNVMLGSYGEVLVMDWGLAKDISPSAANHSPPQSSAENAETLRSSSDFFDQRDAHTLMGDILGTPQYMPPEQARGDVDLLDERADIYSLGAILYHILTLEPPVRPGSKEQMLQRVRSGEITPPTAAVQQRHSGRSPKSPHKQDLETGPASKEGSAAGTDNPDPDQEHALSHLPHLPAGHIPQSLEAVVLKALAIHPEDRYASVGALQEEIAAYQHGYATTAEHAGRLKLLYLFLMRNRAVSAVALVSACFAVAFGIQSYRSEQALRRLRKAAPTFAEQAAAKLDAGLLQDALEKLQFATEVDPNNADYQLFAARLLQGQARLEEAAAAFRRVSQARKDLLAEENLNLCERLLRRFGNSELPQSTKAILLLALHQQARSKDATDLAAELQRNATHNARQIEELLEKIPGWNPSRLRSLPDGTFSLNAANLKISSPASLDHLPISDLKLDSMPLSAEAEWLDTLPRLPLKSLSLRSCTLADLGFLEASRIEVLDLSDNPVSDLTPLQGLPLRKLNLARTKQPDLTPLATCQRLEQLVLPEPSRNVELLKSLPSLQRLSTRESYGTPAQSAHEFWTAHPQGAGNQKR
jgi:serine/threonine protein kinase